LQQRRKEAAMSANARFVAQGGISRRRFLGGATKLGLGLAGAPLLAQRGARGALADSVKISMMGWGSPLEKDNVEKGLQKFHELNPDIEVEWIHVPGTAADYLTKIKTALAGGTPPDLFWGSNLADYVARGVTMDVTDRLQQDPVLGAPDYFIQPQESDRASINGKWYGIGSCWVIHHLYYNAELLDKAGVEPPSTDPAKAWTWDQYLDNARKLTLDSSGKHPDQDGFDANDVQQWGTSWGTWFLPRDVLSYSNGGEAFTNDYTCHLGEQPAVEAIQAHADLFNKHHVAPQAATITQLGMSEWQMLASGKLALLADGSWALQDISKLNFSFGCGVLPMLKQSVTEAQAHVHMIDKDTDQPDASWKLLSFLASDDYQLGLCQAGLWLPSHPSLLTADGLAKWITPGVHPEGYQQLVTDYLLKSSKNYFYPAGFDEADTLITAALDPVWIGDQTAEQALTSGVIDDVNKVLQESKTRLDANTA
jgi:multiple sugar transport system substrate-binding protein